MTGGDWKIRIHLHRAFFNFGETDFSGILMMVLPDCFIRISRKNSGGAI